MFKGKDHVVTCAGIVIWDGITKPEIDEKDQSLTHNIRIAIPNNAPELLELTTIANSALTNSEFKGVLPPGGNWPFAEPDLTKLGPTLAGYTCFTAKTRRGCPAVFDVHGAELTAMSFGRSFYPGAKVSVYVHAYAYNNKQKGVAFGLDGIQVIDATAPALAIGGGVSPQQVADAFASNSAAAGASAAGGLTMTATAPNTYAELIAAGWDDAAMIAAGYAVAAAPKPAAPPPRPAAAPPPPAKAAAAPPPPAKAAAAPPPPAKAAPAPPPPAPTAPHTAILGGGPVMTATAPNTYAELIAAGWDDAAMIAAGYMVAPAAAAPLATGGSAAPPPPARTAPAPVAGKQMLPAAGATTYDEYIAAGWDDAMLIENGFMQP